MVFRIIRNKLICPGLLPLHSPLYYFTCYVVDWIQYIYIYIYVFFTRIFF
jgi:hypothetical protein